MQLLGVPHVGLCAQTPLETPAPPNPPRVWPHMDMPKCSHPPWSTPPVLELVPEAPCCPLQVWSWAVAVEWATGRDWGHHSVLCPSEEEAGPLWHRHLPGSQSQGHPKVLRGLGLVWSSGKPPQPPGPPQLLFCRVVSVWWANPQGCHGMSHPPSTARSCSDSVSHFAVTTAGPSGRVPRAVTWWVTMRSFY